MPGQPQSWEDTRKQGYWWFLVRSGLPGWSLFLAVWGILREHPWGPFEHLASVTFMAIWMGVALFVGLSVVWYCQERALAKSIRRRTASQPSA
jgi:hypothetical protein